MSARRFDAFLIDFYGTVSAGDREAVEAACKRIVETCDLSLTPRQFAIKWGERFFDTIDRSNHRSFRTLHECELLSLRHTLASFGKDHDPAPFLAELDAYWVDPPIYPDALELFATLDLPVCCVSNADTEPLLQAIRSHGLRFDAVITSEKVRAYKPDPKIFRQALDALGVEPQRALHVGDSLHSDVAGANAVGLTAVWIRRDSRIHDIGSCQPEYTISTLTELPILLTL